MNAVFPKSNSVLLRVCATFEPAATAKKFITYLYHQQEVPNKLINCLAGDLSVGEGMCAAYATQKIVAPSVITTVEFNTTAPYNCRLPSHETAFGVALDNQTALGGVGTLCFARSEIAVATNILVDVKMAPGLNGCAAGYTPLRIDPNTSGTIVINLCFKYLSSADPTAKGVTRIYSANPGAGQAAACLTGDTLVGNLPTIGLGFASGGGAVPKAIPLCISF